MAIQTIDQQRAAYALQRVQQIPSNDHKEWLSRANEIPAMIQMNGLGQTAAFYLSKGGIHKTMYDILSKWLCQEMQIFQSHNDLITGITTMDMGTYRMAQAEAQALLLWVKKFSRAYCKNTNAAQGKAEEA